MSNQLTPDTLFQTIMSLAGRGKTPVSSALLAEATGSNLSTVKRALAKLLAERRIQVAGKGRATRYSLSTAVSSLANGDIRSAPATPNIAKSGGPRWRAQSLKIRQGLERPLAARAPVTYRRAFVDEYKANETFLLPRELAEGLTALGRIPGQLPAGTYARKVLEQLLIDLSWSSSHLEGNRYSILDTKELFRSGAPATDSDAVMLLNHKAAIEFLVDAVPTQGLSISLIRNLHAILMRDLLPDAASLGAVREVVVNISGTTYVPTQAPAVLEEMLEQIISKAKQIKSPLEAAFFLWVNLAYLQPFEDGNKRVSRLAANVPLMLYNQAPLSFLDVAVDDYSLAMMAVYELCDVSMAVDLFDWTYRRSQAKYKVVQESLGSPDPLRLKYREALNEAIASVVRNRRPLPDAISEVGIPDADAEKFKQLLQQDLASLSGFNCARYRLGSEETQAWIDKGRPR
jgi:Fic family protein